MAKIGEANLILAQLIVVSWAKFASEPVCATGAKMDSAQLAINGNIYSAFCVAVLVINVGHGGHLN